MLSTRCKYALRALSELALNIDKSNRLTGGDLADRLDIPKPYLSKILQELSRRDLIQSAKGPRGGFYLTEKDLKRTVLEFLDISDCMQSMECVLGLPQCSSKNPCPVHHAYEPLNASFKLKLSGLTISDLATFGSLA